MGNVEVAISIDICKRDTETLMRKADVRSQSRTDVNARPAGRPGEDPIRKELIDDVEFHVPVVRQVDEIRSPARSVHRNTGCNSRLGESPRSITEEQGVPTRGVRAVKVRVAIGVEVADPDAHRVDADVRAGSFTDLDELSAVVPPQPIAIPDVLAD